MQLLLIVKVVVIVWEYLLLYDGGQLHFCILKELLLDAINLKVLKVFMLRIKVLINVNALVSCVVLLDLGVLMEQTVNLKV